MSKHKKSLIAVAVCALMLGASALLPADLSPIGASYAAGGGDNGAGNGNKPGDPAGDGVGLSSDHKGTATRTPDHGVSSKHTGTSRTSKGNGSPTPGTAKNRNTRSSSKSPAVPATKPGTHNTKGQTNAPQNER